jgi:hypothetical protein
MSDATTTVQRFDSTVMFALDLSQLLVPGAENHRNFQLGRAADEFRSKIQTCLTGNVSLFGPWVNEDSRIAVRMDAAEQRGGKKVWTQQFLQRHAPLLLLTTGDSRVLHMPNGLHFEPNSRMDSAGDAYRESVFSGSSYRLAPEGVLVATYNAGFLGRHYRVSDVIRSLSAFRGAAFNTFNFFIRDYFGVSERRKALYSATGIGFADPKDVTTETLRGVVNFHSLVVIEEIRKAHSTGDSETLPISEVMASVDLAGILNEAAWYQSYAPEYCQGVKDKQIGYRSDEIYVTDRRSTVIVSKKFWHEDNPLQFYKHDIALAIEHYLSRLALLKQQSAFYRDHEDVRPSQGEPADALLLVLAGRANLTLLYESLDSAALVRHGFTRKFAETLGEEMDLIEHLRVIEKRIGDMSEAISLKSSIDAAEFAKKSANASIRVAEQNKQLQRRAVIIAVVAVVLTMFFGALTLAVGYVGLRDNVAPQETAGVERPPPSSGTGSSFTGPPSAAPTTG